MKIVLFYASDKAVARHGSRRQEFPAIGLLYVASALEMYNHDVQVLDLSTIPNGSIPYADIIGISINTSYSYPLFLSRSDELQKKCTKLIIGGQHASIFPEICLKDFSADFIVIGEGELSFPSLLCRLENNKDFHDIKGLAFYEKGIFKYSKPERIVNLNDLPFPSRHLINKNEILLDNRIPNESSYSISVMTGRGCPFNCAFCGNLYKQFIRRSKDSIASELSSIQMCYEIEGVVFLDENLLFDEEHILNICELMHEHMLKWTANARVDYYSPNIVSTMKQSGCTEIKFGLESGSKYIIDKMRKGISIDEIEKAIKGTKNAGINTKAFLLFGFPGESIKTAKETINLLKKLDGYLDRVNIFNFAPLPNSLSFKNPSLFDIKLSSDWNNYKIYHQTLHWWGNNNEYIEMLDAYRLLQDFVMTHYNEGVMSSV